MPALEEKRIVIKLPKFGARSCFLILSFLFVVSALGYWIKNVRPFFWIDEAHVETFSTLLSASGQGRIAQMGPGEGDFVRKGEILFVLDADLLRSKKNEAESLISSFYKQIELEKTQIERAMEGYLAASSEDLVRDQLALMDEAQAKVDECEKKVKSAKLELQSIDQQLKKMSFVSPMDGVVLKKAQNQGSVVSFGDPIYVLADPSQIWIEAAISEKELPKVALGSLARLQIPAYPNQEFSGKVIYIGPATVAKSSLLPFSKNNVTIPIKISIENGSLPLKPGLSAKVGLKVR
jgi:RND family efflux transporter MFP subunit